MSTKLHSLAEVYRGRSCATYEQLGVRQSVGGSRMDRQGNADVGHG